LHPLAVALANLNSFGAAKGATNAPPNKRHSKSALYMYIYNGGQGNISIKYLLYYYIFYSFNE